MSFLPYDIINEVNKYLDWKSHIIFLTISYSHYQIQISNRNNMLLLKRRYFRKENFNVYEYIENKYTDYLFENNNNYKYNIIMNSNYTNSDELIQKNKIIKKSYDYEYKNSKTKDEYETLIFQIKTCNRYDKQFTHNFKILQNIKFIKDLINNNSQMYNLVSLNIINTGYIGEFTNNLVKYCKYSQNTKLLKKLFDYIILNDQDGYYYHNYYNNQEYDEYKSVLDYKNTKHALITEIIKNNYIDNETINYLFKLIITKINNTLYKPKKIYEYINIIINHNNNNIKSLYDIILITDNNTTIRINNIKIYIFTKIFSKFRKLTNDAKCMDDDYIIIIKKYIQELNNNTVLYSKFYYNILSLSNYYEDSILQLINMDKLNLQELCKIMDDYSSNTNFIVKYQNLIINHVQNNIINTPDGKVLDKIKILIEKNKYMTNNYIIYLLKYAIIRDNINTEIQIYELISRYFYVNIDEYISKYISLNIKTDDFDIKGINWKTTISR